MQTDEILRHHVADLLDWDSAHIDLDRALHGLSPRLRGKVPVGVPYSVWQLVEHIRLAQRDILEFCIDDEYMERTWPDDYWPKEAAPPSAEAWTGTLRAIREDRAALRELALDPAIELTAPVPHGTGQTYLREILLAADHAAYHVGQIVSVRRVLGAW